MENDSKTLLPGDLVLFRNDGDTYIGKIEVVRYGENRHRQYKISGMGNVWFSEFAIVKTIKF